MLPLWYQLATHTARSPDWLHGCWFWYQWWHRFNLWSNHFLNGYQELHIHFFSDDYGTEGQVRRCYVSIWSMLWSEMIPRHGYREHKPPTLAQEAKGFLEEATLSWAWESMLGVSRLEAATPQWTTHLPFVIAYDVSRIQILEEWWEDDKGSG